MYLGTLVEAEVAVGLAAVEQAKQEEPKEPVREVVVLRMAADLLAKHGWVTGWLGNYFDGFCLVGAVMEAHKLYTGERPRKLYPFYSANYQRLIGKGAGWNDNRPRSETGRQQVIELLRNSADRLEASIVV